MNAWQKAESSVALYESNSAAGSSLVEAYRSLIALFHTENLDAHDPEDMESLHDDMDEESRAEWEAMAAENDEPCLWTRARDMVARMLRAIPISSEGSSREEVDAFCGFAAAIDTAASTMMRSMKTAEPDGRCTIDARVGRPGDFLHMDADFSGNELFLHVPHKVVRSAAEAVRKYIQTRVASEGDPSVPEFTAAWSALRAVERLSDDDQTLFYDDATSLMYEGAIWNLLACMQRSGFDGDDDFFEYLETLIDDVRQDLLESGSKDSVYETQEFSAGESIVVDLRTASIRLKHRSHEGHREEHCCHRDHDQGSATAQIIGAPKIGRNDPCPCGSGKKHKKCCLGKTESSAP